MAFNREEYAESYKRTEKGRSVNLKKGRKYEQSEKGKETRRKYRQTENGKRALAKRAMRRRRNLNWILMFPNPFADSVLVDYHHITDAYVVAIPKELHGLYLGKYHREKMMVVVKQIYLGE